MKQRYYWFIFITLIAAYAALALGLPPNPEVLERYHITATGARLASLTIVVPIIIIWLGAFYGAMKMKDYAAAVQGSKEGPSYNAIATGLMISVMGFPLTSTIAAGLGYIAQRNVDLLPVTTIVRNYITLLFALASFYFIGKGAISLALLVKKRSAAFDNSRWTLTFIVVSCLFSWLIISHYVDGGNGTYYLPDWLVIITIAIPYVVVWYRGAMSAYCIYYYQKKVKGTIYKRALVHCSVGIATVIAASVFIQLVTVFTERLNRLDLTPVLLILYLLVLLYAIGYGLIAKGAKRLKALEEI